MRSANRQSGMARWVEMTSKQAELDSLDSKLASSMDDNDAEPCSKTFEKWLATSMFGTALDVCNAMVSFASCAVYRSVLSPLPFLLLRLAICPPADKYNVAPSPARPASVSTYYECHDAEFTASLHHSEVRVRMGSRGEQQARCAGQGLGAGA